MAEIWVYDYATGKCVLKGATAPVHGVNIIRDTMDMTLHMGDGKHYDSKSRYRATTKALGYIEVGNEKQKPQPQVNRVTRDHVLKAINQLQNGYKPNLRREGDLG